MISLVRDPVGTFISHVFQNPKVLHDSVPRHLQVRCQFAQSLTVPLEEAIHRLTALPAANLKAFRGVLNSTTNLILTRMEGGETQEEAIAMQPIVLEGDIAKI